MKRTIFSAILTVCLAGFLCSCRQDDIDVFGDSRYVYFNTVDGTHDIHYSFLYSNGRDEVQVELPLSYSGRLYDVDAVYAVAVDTEETTAVEGVEFELPERPSFKAASFKSSLAVTLKNSERLATTEQKIRLKLVSNDMFLAAVRDSLTMDIYVTDKISMPSWWTQEVIDAYLGKYSDRKLELFVENIFSGDYGALSSDEKLYYARKFKYWLNENPQYEDGERITVPVIG